MKNYYQQDVECIPYEAMRSLQDTRLAENVLHAYNIPFYREKMDRHGVKPEDIQSVDDINKLPFITKEDLRDAYPYGMLGVPLSEAVRLQSTSGTTGRRVVAFYTMADVELWEECCARAIMAIGGTKDDVVHVSYGYGLFTGGPGLNGGSHKVGSLTLPMSSGFTERQIQFMTDLRSTILCCTPSYAAYLAESIHEAGMIDKICLKAGIFGAEAWSNEMRREIEQKLNIKAYDIYGLTEITGPGVAFECSEQSGMHINEDHFVPEIIDPETGEQLPYGEKGELVFSCITKKAFPLMRYRTRDICTLTRSGCSCGRTLVKMSRLMGRTDDMLIIRGVNVFPSQIETVILNCGFEANYQIIVNRVNYSDSLEVQIEMTPEIFSDEVRFIEKKEKEVVEKLTAMLGITAKVTLVAPKSITRSEGKAVRVIDKRKL